MRQKRAKSYRKQMLVYIHTFKFRAPYQVILDDEIVTIADHARFDLVKYLKNTVQDEVKPMITQCAMQKLYELKNQLAINLAKSFERRRCGHKDNAVPVSECIEGIVNIKGQNKHRYVVVAQDVELRRKLRKIPGIPLIHMNRSVMVMEPLSDASVKKQQRYENAKLSKGLNDVEAGLVKDAESLGEGEQEKAKPKPKRKGPKEPNPLSVKKRKHKDDNAEKDDGAKKRKRRRKHKHGETNNGDENPEIGDDNTENNGTAEYNDTQANASINDNDKETSG